MHCVKITIEFKISGENLLLLIACLIKLILQAAIGSGSQKPISHGLDCAGCSENMMEPCSSLSPIL